MSSAERGRNHSPTAEAPHGNGAAGGLDAHLDRVVPSEPASAFLLVTKGEQVGRVYPLLHNTILIGRADHCDIQLHDPSVSAEHVRILNGALGYEIEDLGSTNGTHVDETRITKSKLGPGQALRLGAVAFTFIQDRRNDVMALVPVPRMAGDAPRDLSTTVQPAPGPLTDSKPTATKSKRAKPAPASAPFRGDRSEALALWFKLARQEWRTLAIVPAHGGGSALALARALAEVGTSLRGIPVELVSADGKDLAEPGQWFLKSSNVAPGSPSANSMNGQSADLFARIICLEPVFANAMGVQVAQSADASLMVIDTGATSLSKARWTMEAIGRERFLGCVMVPHE